MINDELILDYINGELSRENEKKLFTQMAYNDELSLAFKDYLLIKNELESDSFKFYPSDTLSKNIFANSGFKVIDDKKISKNFVKTNKYLNYILSFVLGAIVFTFINYVFIDKYTTALDNYKYNTSQIINDNQHTLPKKIIEKNISKNKKILKSTFPKVISISKNNVIIENTNLSKDTINNNIVEKLNLSEFRNTQLNKRVIIETNRLKEIKNINNNYELWTKNKEKDNKIALEFTKNESWNIPVEKINPNKFNTFNKTGISLFYNFNSNFKAGVGLKQETFYLEYSETNNDTNIYYQQQPNLTTYSINARYLFNKTSGIKPLIGISAGGNKAGAVIRTSLGFEYDIVNNFSILLNAEYSLFLFNHNSEIFNSSKICFNYGLVYKL